MRREQKDFLQGIDSILLLIRFTLSYLHSIVDNVFEQFRRISKRLSTHLV